MVFQEPETETADKGRVNGMIEEPFPRDMRKAAKSSADTEAQIEDLAQIGAREEQGKPVSHPHRSSKGRA